MPQNRVMRSACTAVTARSASSSGAYALPKLATAARILGDVSRAACFGVSKLNLTLIPEALPQQTNNRKACTCQTRQGLQEENSSLMDDRDLMHEFAHLDERVGLRKVVAAGGLVVEVARMRLCQPVAAAEHVSAAALEARQPDLQPVHAKLSNVDKSYDVCEAQLQGTCTRLSTS